MNEQYYVPVAQELSVNALQVKSVAQLIEEGGTIPFIARYRKEATGGLDEVVIQKIRDRMEQFAQLDKRREAIVKSLVDRELLTDELDAGIKAAATMTELEDIYLPFRPKKRTKATIAKEKGLEPLARIIYEQPEKLSVEYEASKYVNPEKKVEDFIQALQGARDIIAEWVSEDVTIKNKLRKLFAEEAILSSKVVKGKNEEGEKFRDYFKWQEPAAKTAGHRLLAMLRGQKEGVLKLTCLPEEERAIKTVTSGARKSFCLAWEQVKMAMVDSCKRLLLPSIENEFIKSLREKAEEQAIGVFASNLKELLMAPALGQKRVMAVDPGYRTGCKVVCLDSQGKLLKHEVIFVTHSEKMLSQAELIVRHLVDTYNVEVVAIGNGTASRETEAFFKNFKPALNIPVIVVNESGASVYSASEVARKEFSDYDVTVRGAVSIGRRLMDPLAELVKIDPKAIGVGQYQHDVDQTNLKKSLDDVVSSCVNRVGVEINTASKELLSYVAGLGKQLAENIVKVRDESGAFSNRMQLLKIPRLGPKAFEQCAGFLRIRNSNNPLDASAVHPESYQIVHQMAEDLSCSIEDLLNSSKLRSEIKLENYKTETVGLPTLHDIMQELAKPGRDPREKFELFSFAEGVNEMKDLQVGMELPGIVTNVTNFGAFVDIGVHQDGLVHISQLSDNFVKDPALIVKVHQKVKVKVLEVDIQRKRISLSMKTGKPKKKETFGI